MKFKHQTKLYYIRVKMDGQKLSLFQFELLSVLGYGNYAKILLVRKKTDSKIYAIKIIKKYKQDSFINKNHAYVQKSILKQCVHPFIVRFYGAFQRYNKLYFVLEYCPGGQLFGIIKRNYRISQQRTRFYAAQIFLVLEFLHSKKIIYRDLKPENLLIDDQGYIKLIDFGLSCYAEETITNQIAGTPEYLAPQVFDPQVRIGYELDWWCFGCMIFQMMTGLPPFYVLNESKAQLIKKIKTSEPPLDRINSPIQRSFLEGLLQKNPKKRLGFKGSDEIRNHLWMRNIDWQKIISKGVKAPFVPDLHDETDMKWFDDNFQSQNLTPSDEDSAKSAQSYQGFSVSWRSSCEKTKKSSKNASPIEITLDIKEEQLIQ